MLPMPDVYISHAPIDDAIATRIYFAAAASGICTWVDHVHGEEPESRISKGDLNALASCEAGLFILSPGAVICRKCTFEWQTILKRGKRLIVAISEQIPPDDLPDLLWNPQIAYVDLTRNIDRALVVLIRALAGQMSA